MKKWFLAGIAIIVSIGLHAQVLTPGLRGGGPFFFFFFFPLPPQKKREGKKKKFFFLFPKQIQIRDLTKMLNEAIAKTKFLDWWQMIVKKMEDKFTNLPRLCGPSFTQKMKRIRSFPNSVSRQKPLPLLPVMMLWGRRQISINLIRFLGISPNSKTHRWWLDFAVCRL